MNKIALNPIQYKFWVDDRIHYPSVALNDTNISLVVKGNLLMDKLHEAFRILMLEYPPLRSKVKVVEQQPYFFVDDEFAVPFECKELDGDLDVLQTADLDKIIMPYVSRPFDIETEYPCRFYVFHSGEYWLILPLFHHLVMDGVSYSTFFSRLETLYNALCAQTPIVPQMQRDQMEKFHADFLKANQPRKELGLEYWKSYIGNTPLTMAIPTCSDQDGVQQQQAVTFTLGDSVLAAFQKMVAHKQTTAFRLLAAIWGMTLAKFFVSADFLLDHAVSLRPQLYKDLFGVFVNNLPLRFQLEEGSRVDDLLTSIAESRRQSQPHALTFYHDLLPLLSSSDQRGSGINVSINYPIPQYSAHLSGCTFIRDYHYNVPITQDFVLVIDDDSDFTCHLRYNAQHPRAYAESLAAAFQTVLLQVLEHPDITFGALQLVSPAQQQQRLALEEESLHAFREDALYLERFAAVCARYPDRIAVADAQRALTYAELEALSNRVAAYLHQQGIVSRPVALSMPKCVEMVVAIWGILKSGNVYVPIDATHPQSRIDFILSDCGVAAVIVNSATGVTFSCPTFDIDEVLSVSDGPYHPVAIHPTDTAYVIYTSGTTGQPKGTPIQHGMLAGTAFFNAELQQLDTQAVVLQFANISFDASIVELFPVLSVGGRLELPTEAVRKDVTLLLQFLEEKQITTLVITASLLSVFPRVRLDALKTIMVGGDATPQDVIDYWSAGRLFINAYGPTENTVDATYALLTPGDYAKHIGRSMPGTTTYVLDAHLNMVPDYAVGELYLGGKKLTAGYLNRPELNQERFLPNPFVSESDRAQGVNTRIYKTGDLVMRRADGGLLFVGRADFQVKFHGFRIELGDIEAQILSFSKDISNAVVGVHEQDGVKQLVAYVQTEVEDVLDFNALKSHLQQHLPAYMVPAHWVPLTQLPFNTSGKVDRKALAALPLASGIVEEEKELSDAPQTPVEKALVPVWQKLLHTAAVGRDDHFVALGGDSMSVILLVFEIEQSFGVKVLASELYQHLTLREMAALIAAKQDGAATAAATEEVEQNFLPLAPVQLELWMQCAVSPEMKDAYNLPVVFELPVTASLTALEEGLNRCIALQDSFRMIFPLHQGQPHLQIQAPVPLQLVPQPLANDDAFQTAFLTDMQTSFDLEKGPLYRATLYESPSGKRFFVLVMHHLISDGWSALLLQQVLAAAAQGQPVLPEQLTGSYADYARSANRPLTAAELQQRQAFWRQYLAEVEPLQLLAPLQGQRLEVKGKTQVRQLGAKLHHAVQSWCRQQAATPFSFYYAAFLLLLARLGNSSNFLVGTPVSGRDDLAYSRTVGYFVQLLPMCYEASCRDLTFSAWVHHLKARMVEAEQHLLPTNTLLEAAGHELSDDRAWPLVKAVFSYEKDDRYLSYLAARQVATFPLTCMVAEGEQGATCYLEYQQQYVDDRLADQMLEAYAQLLSAILEDPDRQLTTYRLVSRDVVQQVVQENSLSERPQAVASLPFLEVFHRQVTLRPEAVAVVCRDIQISYAELDRRSTALASYLLAYPPGPVAVAMSPSVSVYVVILAILKAGRIYVPVDPALPVSRQQFLCTDAACSLLFADDALEELALLEATLPVCRSSQLSDICVHAIDAVALPVVKPTDGAYCIYTSGTTGQPKGIVIRHAALGQLVAAEEQLFALTPTSRVLQFASISFDAAVTEIFTTWACGATLVAADDEQRHDPQLLADLLEEERITCATIPPALLPLLPKRAYPDLTTIIVGGESTAPAAIAYWSQGRRFLNAYGPTENTVDATVCIVDATFEPNDIGVPLPGVSCYVLDQGMQIVPEGRIGELYIGGLQLAEGYLNRPELTARQFVDNPYVSPADRAKDINLKLYRSGDLVRRRADGHFIFIGRADTQVKVRGMRIELSEIEKVIEQQAGVEKVLVRVNRSGAQDFLEAFVQQASDTSLVLPSLRNQVQALLPAYMLPNRWAILNRFPMTVNGKIDVSRLPQAEALAEKLIVAPANENEQKLAQAVARLMGTEAISVEADLTDEVGMTSMQVMTWVMEMTEAGYDLTISSVYRHRTIRRILQDTSRRPYFWANPYQADKPLWVLICGYPSFTPFYDDFIRYWQNDFSIFVFESYCDTLYHQADISFDLLMQHYAAVLEQELQGKPLFAITGLCMGSELAIALANYRIAHGATDFPKILNLDGVYARPKDVLPAVPGNARATEHNRIISAVYRDMPALDYPGDIIHVMAQQISRRLDLPEVEEEDDAVIEAVIQFTKASQQTWRDHFPTAPYIALNATHWDFFQPENLTLIREAVHRYWKI